MRTDKVSDAKARKVETDRLVMVPHRIGDFPDCAALWRDPEVTRFVTGRPASEEESWSRFLRYLGHWSAMGFGYWTVRQKSTGRYVGEVGFAQYRRAIEPSLGDSPEIGWVLAGWAHGQGFAIEAVRAATAWGDRNFRGRDTVCIIAPDHIRSVRVAEKAGYRDSGRAVYKDRPTMVFTRAGNGSMSPSPTGDRSQNPAVLE